MRGKKILLFTFMMMTALIAVQIMTRDGWGQNDSQQKLNQERPIVDYESAGAESVTESATRRAKSTRYDRRLVVRDVDTGGSPVLNFSQWEVIPALPVARSALVAIGEVLDAKAYLSSDKTGVYSEFTIRVQQVFKSDDLAPVFPGESVTAERIGGAVRFPSGRVIIYGNRGQGMPRASQQYLFFLERNPQQYSIITAYQLRSDQVHPLDGRSRLGGEDSEWRGNSYEGMKVARLLDDVNSAISRHKGAVQP